MLRIPLIVLLFALSANQYAAAQTCAGSPVAVQILGSGGPTINPDRASSSYLLWVGDKAKVMVDMGGGAFLRFGQSRAKLSDLSMMAVSHLHPDHISDLPALLWLSHRSRPAPLPIIGPSGNSVAPDFPTFLARLFDEKTGAFQVLGSTLSGNQGNRAGGFHLNIGVVDVTKPEPTMVHSEPGLTVTAFGIPHGDLPTLAYRVQAGDKSVVFSSDQNGTNPKFVDFARGANVLVMHMAVAPGEVNPRHAEPALVGRIAQAAGVGRLIVSHIGPFDLDIAISELKKTFSGALTVGADLQCTAVQ